MTIYPDIYFRQSTVRIASSAAGDKSVLQLNGHWDLLLETLSCRGYRNAVNLELGKVWAGSAADSRVARGM
jgi:hypothetical protein